MVKTYILIGSLFLSGCATLNPAELMPAEAQAARLISCASLNLDHQVVTNNLQQVIDITCIPRYGYDYKVMRMEQPEVKDETKKE